MWKYEQEFRINKPETVGEKDKHFDLDNYKDWLEEQLTDCRKQLSIQRVVWQSEQLCDNPHCQNGTVEVIYGEPLRCSSCDK